MTLYPNTPETIEAMRREATELVHKLGAIEVATIEAIDLMEPTANILRTQPLAAPFIVATKPLLVSLRQRQAEMASILDQLIAAIETAETESL